MMGTLAGLLAKMQIPTDESHYRASVKGNIEDVKGVLKITRIHVHYDLKVPPGKTDDAQQAFRQYLSNCPAAQSVIGCIRIEHDIAIAEEEAVSH